MEIQSINNFVLLRFLMQKKLKCKLEKQRREKYLSDRTIMTA